MFCSRLPEILRAATRSLPRLRKHVFCPARGLFLSRGVLLSRLCFSRPIPHWRPALLKPTSRGAVSFRSKSPAGHRSALAFRQPRLWLAVDGECEIENFFSPEGFLYHLQPWSQAYASRPLRESGSTLPTETFAHGQQASRQDNIPLLSPFSRRHQRK